MTGLILDIVVVVVVLLLLIFGIWRGMYKIVFGLVSSLLAIILTVILTSSVTAIVIERTQLDERLTIVLDAPLSSKLPNANVIIQYYDINGDGSVSELGYIQDGTVHPVADLLSGTPYSILSGTVESVLTKNIDQGENMAFVSVLSAALVAYIMLAAVSIVLLIIFTILTKLLMYILKKFVNATYFGNFVNKLVGAVLGLAIAAVVIWGSLAVIRMLSTYQWIIPVNQIIESSTLTKLLFNNNYLYNFLVQTYDVKGIVDSIIAKASALSS